MQRGQAFDAFKLLIAAVVAGAILVILLSMIGGFVSPGQAPLTVMGQEMNKVKTGGVCSTSTLVVQFSAGEEISSDAVARQAGMNLGNVEFCAGSNDNIEDSQCTGYEFDDTYFEGKETKPSSAVVAMTSLSVAHMVIIVFIILGNIGYYLSVRRKGGPR